MRPEKRERFLVRKLLRALRRLHGFHRGVMAEIARRAERDSPWRLERASKLEMPKIAEPMRPIGDNDFLRLDGYAEGHPPFLGRRSLLGFATFAHAAASLSATSTQ